MKNLKSSQTSVEKRLSSLAGEFVNAGGNTNSSKRITSIINKPYQIEACAEEKWTDLPVECKKLGEKEFCVIDDWMKTDPNMLDRLGHNKFFFGLQQFRYKVRPTDVNASSRFYICYEIVDKKWRIVMNHIEYVQSLNLQNKNSFHILIKNINST